MFYSDFFRQSFRFFVILQSDMQYYSFFRLMQVALGKAEAFPESPSDDEWTQLYRSAVEQSLVGVLYDALQHLPEQQEGSGGSVIQPSHLGRHPLGSYEELSGEFGSNYEHLNNTRSVPEFALLLPKNKSCFFLHEELRNLTKLFFDY